MSRSQWLSTCWYIDQTLSRWWLDCATSCINVAVGWHYCFTNRYLVYNDLNTSRMGLYCKGLSYFAYILEQKKIAIFSSTGRRPGSLCHGPLSVMHPSVRASVRPSVRPLTFSLNIFFSETTYRILMKFDRNVPTMVLFRISWNNLIPSKTLVAMATKLKIFWNLWKSSCQKP